MPSPVSHYPEERRLATVLFADVQGFTSLAEQLDFETVSDLIKGIWERLDHVIEENGGYIDKHLGDGVMAVWGAPFAGESDAEAAITAALALQWTMNDFAARSKVPGANTLKLRVGLNSGSVFAGYVGTKSEYTVIGDTVNVAARLEQAAEAGTVVIGEATYRLVRGIFSFRQLPPVQAKGKVEPVLAYEVQGKLTNPTRVRYQGVDSLETHMVGREKELARLNELFQFSQTASTPTLVLVIAEVGMGKSRLLMEFGNTLEVSGQPVTMMSARALAQTSRISHYMWRNLMRNRFDIRDSDVSNTAILKFEREMQKYWGDRNHLEPTRLIGNMIGLDWGNVTQLSGTAVPPNELTRRTYDYVRELLRRLCTESPSAIFLDDLQWADRDSLSLLARILEADAKPLPLLILGGARPDFLREHPQWRNSATIINLSPLPISAETVSSAYPELQALPQQILVELAARSEGNPYFLEEIVKGMVKTGLGTLKSAPHDAMVRLQSQIPESLRATLQARLDHISREARTVALLASVVGRVFWVGAVLAAARANTGTGALNGVPAAVLDRLVQDGLRQLVRAELAFPRAGSKYSKDQEYIFKNSFLRDVAYSLIPNRNRTIYHRAVAQWLADHNDMTFNLMAAEHYEHAGAYHDAAGQYEQAAQIALSRGSKNEAQALQDSATIARTKAREKHG
jgi:adenylate cyclase